MSQTPKTWPQQASKIQVTQCLQNVSGAFRSGSRWVKEQNGKDTSEQTRGLDVESEGDGQEEAGSVLKGI